MDYPPRNAEINQERMPLPPIDHAALTATTTVLVWQVPAGRSFRVDRVLYHNVTGLAADNANTFKCELMNDAVLVGEVFNTDGDDDPVGAAIPADEFVEVTSFDAPVLAAGDVLSVVFTEEGTATLPAGRLIVEGRLL